MAGVEALPARRDILVRGGLVLTMEPDLGEFRGDVEVRDGEIVALGPVPETSRATTDSADSRLPDGEVIDATGGIVLPGFVDTHWHLWGTLLRGVIGDGPTHGWFARKAALGPHLRPQDTAAGARLALAEGLAAGITTVHDWAHNVLSRADAEANVAADIELGARVHWSWGVPSTTPGLSLEEMSRVVGRLGRDVDEAMDVGAVAELREAWRGRADGRLTVGVNLRGPARSTQDVYRREFEDARRHGLPIAMHCAGTRAEVARIRQVEVLARDGLLGPDLLLAHGNHLPAEDIASAAAAGVAISISPLSELRLAMGFLQVREFLAAGVRVSFSLDTTAIAASADPFQALRVAVGLEGVRHGDPTALSPRRALELATIEGARSLGLGETTGSLRPGKRADLIVVRTDALNVAPAVDPAIALVHAAAPANVDTVIVDGRILKRAGRLVAVDEAAVVAEAEAALLRVCERAGLEVPADSPAGRRRAPAAAGRVT
ncbi:MAG TPA: amidohydrolase family protein [Candidatus Limnocylindrales bacterium]|nr:amidohydrolase family protein [Candidatus Limnocylindrales bacterium]